MYTLTVVSTDPAAGVTIAASPADLQGKTGGNTGLTLSYDVGTAVTLTASASSSTTIFDSWTGCNAPAANVCLVTVTGNTTVTAGYVAPPKGVAQVTVTPGVISLSIGSGQQFVANATGTGTFDTSVAWSVATSGSTSGGTSPSADAGTITSSGAYQTPYPAPSSVTVTATSNADPTVSGKAVITLGRSSDCQWSGPFGRRGRGDASDQPLIYGMNAYQLDPSIATKFHLPVDRWGGDATTRYNYLLDVANNDNDYFFETLPNDNTQYRT